MAKPIDVNETWTIRTSSAPERIAEEASMVLNQHKCVVSRTSPTVVTATFSYRPVQWLVLAIVLIPITLMTSLLFLLVRSTATVNAVVESRPGYRVIRLAGAAPEVVLNSLRAAYVAAGAVEGEPSGTDGTDLRIAPIPGSGTPAAPEAHEASSWGSAHADAPVVAASMPLDIPSALLDDAVPVDDMSGSTRLRAPAAPHVAADPDPATRLRLSTPLLIIDTSADPLPWPEFGLLGRDPTAGRGDPEATTTIAVDDPDRVVSKTHVAIGRDQHGLWVMDRQSTNGTSVINRDGHERPLTPGARTPVQVGDVILLGGERRVEAVVR